MKGEQMMMLQLFEVGGTQGSSSPRKAIERIILICLRTSSPEIARVNLTCRVRRRLDCVEELHGLNVVEIYLMLKHNH